ncbi:MAG: DegT/DnrJ/EryC1/StrS aminotransferase family protein [Alphaproteobacteria bacterium]|nr:DegT/DnrJ/EryC1/StrS aminotransferase family protein [Alphaproteobacteria bacterium]
MHFYRHGLTGADAKAIADVLDTPFLTSGAVGKKVEAMLASFFEMPHALLVNSWTNGALAALLAMDIGPGDEVIVPAQTFIATANMVELVGAKPVFVDVDPDTLLMTPDMAARAVTPKTKACIPVHMYGLMCDMKGLRAALPSSIKIIEDCAHCFEGTRDGELPGRHSDMSIFSFYATKNVTCGEGGAVVLRDSDLFAKLQQTRQHGMSAVAADRFKAGQYRHWDMGRLGVKANLPDLLAALLPQQIETIRERLPQRTALADRYRDAFANLPIRLQRLESNCVSAEHLFPIHVRPSARDAAIAALNAAGVPVTVNYRSVPTLTYYREKYGYGPKDFANSWEWGEGEISLPLWPGMPDEDQQKVIDTVKAAVVPLCR